MKITIIGLGLIGGSIAIDLRKAGFASAIGGIELNPSHGKKALELGLVDALENEGEAIASADLIFLAIHVNTSSQLIPSILD